MTDGQKMTDEEYSETQARLLLLAATARTLDIERFLDRIEDTETLAPLFDPTLYMRGYKKLELVKKLAKAALVLKREADRQYTEEAEVLRG